MNVLITQKSIKDEHGADLDALESAYIDFFIKENIFSNQAVFTPVPNNLNNLQKLTTEPRPGLVILTGGNNIDPQTFGSDENLDGLARRRDKVEAQLLDFALANKVPVLGICRGFQFINVHLGGKLTLNLPDHPPRKNHLCNFDEKAYQVNSYHNQGVTPVDLSKELKPIAKTPDGGIIEAFTGRDKRILGVQWHPERSGADTQLFKLLVNKYLHL